MLGGAVDAIACEPTTEMTVVAASADHGSDQRLPDNDGHGGACVHGHCHHGTQQVPQMVTVEDLPIVAALPSPSGGRRLTPITPEALKRPPRA